ncbi:hypothetical protein EPO34_02265 [Patescibacteria group bacterium]|nr:MAG: hypothetical protein EPO34_02265 [Patescibacteria group bacterium]
MARGDSSAARVERAEPSVKARREQPPPLKPALERQRALKLLKRESEGTDKKALEEARAKIETVTRTPAQDTRRMSARAAKEMDRLTQARAELARLAEKTEGGAGNAAKDQVIAQTTADKDRAIAVSAKRLLENFSDELTAAEQDDFKEIVRAWNARETAAKKETAAKREASKPYAPSQQDRVMMLGNEIEDLKEGMSGPGLKQVREELEDLGVNPDVVRISRWKRFATGARALFKPRITKLMADYQDLLDDVERKQRALDELTRKEPSKEQLAHHRETVRGRRDTARQNRAQEFKGRKGL